MAACATSARTSTGSPRWLQRDGSSSHGGPTITSCVRTAPLAAWHPPSLPTALAKGMRTPKLDISGLKTGSTSQVLRGSLNQHWFINLDAVIGKCATWRSDYNEMRPYNPIGNKPPISLLIQFATHGPSWPAGTDAVQPGGARSGSRSTV